MKKKELICDTKWCKGCGICVAFCPRKVLTLQNDKVKIEAIDKCIYCGQCEQRCPDYAIYIKESENE